MGAAILDQPYRVVDWRVKFQTGGKTHHRLSGDPEWGGAGEIKGSFMEKDESKCYYNVLGAEG